MHFVANYFRHKVDTVNVFIFVSDGHNLSISEYYLVKRDFWWHSAQKLQTLQCYQSVTYRKPITWKLMDIQFFLFWDLSVLITNNTTEIYRWAIPQQQAVNFTYFLYFVFVHILILKIHFKITCCVKNFSMS